MHSIAPHFSSSPDTLQRRHGKHLSFINGKQRVDFLSPSFLGLETDPRVLCSAFEAISQFGLGHCNQLHKIHTTLTAALNRIFCNSHTALLPKIDTLASYFFPLLCDNKLPHYSLNEKPPFYIIDKRFLQDHSHFIQKLPFHKNCWVLDFSDTDLLARVFADPENGCTPIALCHSIFAFEQAAPIDLLLSLANTHKGYVFMDDSLGFSLYGQSGAGYVLNTLNHQFHPRLFLSGSFSNSFNGSGHLLALPYKEDMKIFLDCLPSRKSSLSHSPLWLFTLEACTHIHLSEELKTLQTQLSHNLHLFDSHLKPYCLNAGSPSPFRHLFTETPYKTQSYVYQLEKAGFSVGMHIPNPATQELKEKCALRISLAANHTEHDIDSLCHTLLNILGPDALGSTF
jgi:7-keto-8-aminopelargonate synthetase-like enzyme